MIPVYAISVVLGVIAVFGWIFLGVTSSSVEGKADLDPEARFGSTGRTVVAAVIGFGLGGMSASFAGWSTIPALFGAVAGAGLMTAAARYLGIDDGSDGDPA